MNNDHISNRIRRLRFDHGEMTQQELADKAGVTRQTIIAIEAGKYAPSLPLAFRIARAFTPPSRACFNTRTARRQPTHRSRCTRNEGSPARLRSSGRGPLLYSFRSVEGRPAAGTPTLFMKKSGSLRVM
jgi:putative transcriptional regulator